MGQPAGGLLTGVLPGGGAARLAENLLGLQAAIYPPDTITDAAVVAIAAAQRPDGSWRSNEIQHRPPITQSSFGATAKINRVLQHYAIPARKQEFAQTIERARIWLTKAKPVTTEDYTMRVDFIGAIHLPGVRAAARSIYREAY